MSTHLNFKPPNCPFCDFKTKNGDDYVNHVDNHGVEILQKLIDKETKKFRVIREEIKCPFCDFKTETLEDIANHIDMTHQ